MAVVPFALYDAFSETAFGGSQAGVVSDAAELDQRTRQQIATEIGAPATAFIIAYNEQSIRVRFHSPVTEYNMCGHGTVCLITRMIEQDVLPWTGKDCVDVKLCLPSFNAQVQVFRRIDGRPEVFLDINPPQLSQLDLDRALLADLLGLRTVDFDQDSPLEIANGDFIHLIVPLQGLAEMARITPDFRGLVSFCKQHDLQTIAVFCTEVSGSGYDVHMRDFCPAVGVPESAGAGTTNAALATYLVKHNFIQPADGDNQIVVQAEQGIELERSSTIRSVVSMNGKDVSRLQVGGVATKIFDGKLFIPN